MPFDGSIYPFNWPTIRTSREIGGVYGLFSRTPFGLVCKYVGNTDNLRMRLVQHLSSPPVPGISHWSAEAHILERQQTHLNLEKDFIAKRACRLRDDRWLFVFSAIQAVASLGMILVYFGIIPDRPNIHVTLTALPSVWWLVAAFVLFLGSMSFTLYGFYRSKSSRRGL